MGRRFSQRIVYVLIAALLLAQQGLALHVLAHGVDALKVSKQGQPAQRGLPADRQCELCMTYAQVAAGAPAATPIFTAPSLEHAALLPPFFSTRAPVGHAYHSRAPPRFA